ncbi:acetyltransferase [Providencia alcalifaciens]|nr:acetyltransferase [Providencia alcalifaciens]SQI43140.1 Galactoside O-acetyltransferase [Providencia alcalifaciens]
MNFLIKKIIIKIFKITRVLAYSYISDQKLKCKKLQPVLVKGDGVININSSVTFGVERSNHFFTSYAYIDSRGKSSSISIDKNCVFNNSATIISDHEKITIGENCIFGSNLEIINSDFHKLYNSNAIKRKKIIIGNNVFIGNNVKILKGSIIEDNVTIANGSIVCSHIRMGVTAAGIPAKEIKQNENA